MTFLREVVSFLPGHPSDADRGVRGHLLQSEPDFVFRISGGGWSVDLLVPAARTHELAAKIEEYIPSKMPRSSRFEMLFKKSKLTVEYDNRGDPYAEGVTFTIGEEGLEAYVFMNGSDLNLFVRRLRGQKGI